MIKLKGTVKPVMAVKGVLGGLTYTERAEIEAELKKLLAETDPMWIERMKGWSIAAKIRFLQLCRGSILNSIRNKGVTVPNPQPFRTIHTLIDQIGTGGGSGEPVAFLYNGVRLPDIYSVYTPELQEQYGAAVIGLDEVAGEYYLLLFHDYSYYYPRVDDDGTLHTMYAYGCFKAVGGQWIESSKPSLPKAVWGNVDIIISDGISTDGIYLYATDPVPVYE